MERDVRRLQSGFVPLGCRPPAGRARASGNLVVCPPQVPPRNTGALQMRRAQQDTVRCGCEASAR